MYSRVSNKYLSSLQILLSAGCDEFVSVEPVSGLYLNSVVLYTLFVIHVLFVFVINFTHFLVKQPLQVGKKHKWRTFSTSVFQNCNTVSELRTVWSCLICKTLRLFAAQHKSSSINSSTCCGNVFVNNACLAQQCYRVNRTQELVN